MMRHLESLGRVGLLWAVCARGSPALQAHNFWIELSTFTPAVGQRVTAWLPVGQELKGDPVPRDPSLMKRFVTVGPSGEAPVPGVPNTEPPGFPVFPSPGLYTVVYDSSRYAVALDAAKFEEYLKQEGLEKIAALRARQGKSAAGAKEVFSRWPRRSPRWVVLLGPGFDRVFGQRLELGGGEGSLRARRGRGSAGAPALRGEAARRRARHGAPARPAREGDGPHGRQGACHPEARPPRFLADQAGNMIPAPPDAGADWESFWASLTFTLPAR